MTDWAQYFKEYRQGIEDEVVDEPAEVVILRQGHEVNLVDMPSGARKIANRLEGMGFEVKCGSSTTFHEGAVFLSGDKEGQRRPDKTVTHFFVQARHEQGFKFWGSWEDGSFKGALCAENKLQAVLDTKQKERTGETLSVALQRVLSNWEGMITCSY
jgi:hypothetical protein